MLRRRSTNWSPRRSVVLGPREGAGADRERGRGASVPEKARAVADARALRDQVRGGHMPEVVPAEPRQTRRFERRFEPAADDVAYPERRRIGVLRPGRREPCSVSIRESEGGMGTSRFAAVVFGSTSSPRRSSWMPRSRTTGSGRCSSIATGTCTSPRSASRPAGWKHGFAQSWTAPGPTPTPTPISARRSRCRRWARPGYKPRMDLRRFSPASGVVRGLCQSPDVGARRTPLRGASGRTARASAARGARLR